MSKLLNHFFKNSCDTERLVHTIMVGVVVGIAASPVDLNKLTERVSGAVVLVSIVRSLKIKGTDDDG